MYFKTRDRGKKWLRANIYTEYREYSLDESEDVEKIESASSC